MVDLLKCFPEHNLKGDDNESEWSFPSGAGTRHLSFVSVCHTASLFLPTTTRPCPRSASRGCPADTVVRLGQPEHVALLRFRAGGNGRTGALGHAGRLERLEPLDNESADGKKEVKGHSACPTVPARALLRVAELFTPEKPHCGGGRDCIRTCNPSQERRPHSYAVQCRLRPVPQLRGRQAPWSIQDSLEAHMSMSQSDPTLEDKRKTFAFRSPTSTPWFFSLVRSMRKILLHLQMFPNGDDMALNIPDSAPVNPRRSHAAVLRGDSEMYVIDRVPERLPKTKEIGCMPIDFSASDPVHQIKALRGGKEVDRGVAGTCS